MTAVLENSQAIRAALESLQRLVEQLRESFVGGIHTPDEYQRASILLDELTDGHSLNKYETQVLIELEEAIQTYERDSEQFAAINANLASASTPVQLLRDFMDVLGLSGSDLPEVGDRHVVSKCLRARVRSTTRWPMRWPSGSVPNRMFSWRGKIGLTLEPHARGGSEQ